MDAATTNRTKLIQNQEDYRAFVLTLESSYQRSLERKFQDLSTVIGDIEIVHGVDGRRMSSIHYYSEMIGGFRIHGKVLSPSEVGCALSHVSILKKFLSSQAKIAVIFEDDVLIGKESPDLLSCALSALRENDLLVAGCQQGLEYLGPILGSRLGDCEGCYMISQDSWASVKRTCAYAIGRKTAAHVIRVQEVGLWPADDFRVLCPNDGRLLFCEAFAHPRDLQSSDLEKERRLHAETNMPRALVLRLADEVNRSLLAKGTRARNWINLLRGKHRLIHK